LDRKNNRDLLLLTAPTADSGEHPLWSQFTEEVNDPAIAVSHLTFYM
jgi:hypothetical protein